jgi:hypothetical protein
VDNEQINNMDENDLTILIALTPEVRRKWDVLKRYFRMKKIPQDCWPIEDWEMWIEEIRLRL